MTFNFTPLSDEELDMINLMDEGIYDFEVVKCTAKTSKSGNQMAELQLKVWGIDARVHIIYDYLVFSTVPLCIRKVSHFCNTVGLQDAYKAGQLTSDLQGYSGKVEIGIEDERPNPNGGNYPKKNYVIDYIKNDGSKPRETAPDPFNDDLPF